jgi:hypothetical protein
MGYSLEPMGKHSKTENTYTRTGKISRIIDFEWDTEDNLWVMLLSTKRSIMLTESIKLPGIAVDTLSEVWYPGLKMNTRMMTTKKKSGLIIN